MSKKKSLVKNSSDLAQAAESHLSLGLRGWTMLVGGSGGTGVIALLKGLTDGLRWYDITLIVLFSVLGVAFAVFGVLAFMQSLKVSKQREGQMSAEDAWGKRPFKDFQTVIGGTHSLSDIFRGDKIRAKMIFRDCIIHGAGAVVFTGCSIKNFTIHANRMPMVIEGDATGTVTLYINEFVECTFENVIFSNCLLFGNGIVLPDAPVAFLGYKNMPNPNLAVSDSNENT